MDKEKDLEKENDKEKEGTSIPEDDTDKRSSSEDNEIKTEKPAKPRKSKSKLVVFLLIFLAIVTAGALSGSGVYLWQKNKVKPATEEPKPEAEEKKEESAEIKETENVVYASPEVGLNMRKSASLTAEIITILKYGTKLTVEKEEGAFYFGKDAAGNEGYFAKEFTTKTDPLSEWLTYNGVNYAVKYPKDWLKKTCDGSDSAGFGPDEASLQLCNSEKFALISISTAEGTKVDYIADTKSGLDTFTESNITVSGADAVRLEGKTKGGEVGPQAGSTSISVVLEAGANILVLNYMQNPAGTDYSDIFDLMVENFSLAG